jgi:hypothetical protein
VTESQLNNLGLAPLAPGESHAFPPIVVSACRSIAVTVVESFGRDVNITVSPSLGKDPLSGVAFPGISTRGGSGDPVHPEPDGTSTAFLDSPFDVAYVSIANSTNTETVSPQDAWLTCIPDDVFDQGYLLASGSR